MNVNALGFAIDASLINCMRLCEGRWEYGVVTRGCCHRNDGARPSTSHGSRRLSSGTIFGGSEEVRRRFGFSAALKVYFGFEILRGKYGGVLGINCFLYTTMMYFFERR